MKYDVVLSEEAENDIRGIFEYIAFTLLSLENAAGQIGRIEDQILKLDEMPYRFPLMRKEPWRSRGLRFLPVDNYLVFYIPDDSLARVTVIRVLYGARSIDNLIQ